MGDDFPNLPSVPMDFPEIPSGGQGQNQPPPKDKDDIDFDDLSRRRKRNKTKTSVRSCCFFCLIINNAISFILHNYNHTYEILLPQK